MKSVSDTFLTDFRSYDALKKYIYQLEKQQHDLGRSSLDLEANEREYLIQQTNQNATDALFVPLLDKELKKITLFYESQEKELLDAVTDLEKMVAEQEEAGLDAESHYLDDEFEDDDEDDDDELHHSSHIRDESRSPKRRRRRLSSVGPRYAAGKNLCSRHNVAWALNGCCYLRKYNPGGNSYPTSAQYIIHRG